MSAEDHNGGRSPSVNTTKVAHSLDDLAKELASGTISRRKAVRLLGAALLGGVLGSVPGMALGQSRGNSACAQCCQETFPPGRERGQCVRECAIGQGPCGPCPQTCCCNCFGQLPDGSFGVIACTQEFTTFEACRDYCQIELGGDGAGFGCGQPEAGTRQICGPDNFCQEVSC
jgi:hypothetical protein